MKGDDHRHFCRLMRPDAPDLDTGKPTEPGERLADDCRAASETEDVWKALKRSNRLVGRHFFICAVPMIERHGQEGRVAVIAALESWGADVGASCVNVTRNAASRFRLRASPGSTTFLRGWSGPSCVRAATRLGNWGT